MTSCNLEILLKMKQITKETVVSILQGKEVELKPTQNKICLPILNRLYLKMSKGIGFAGIKIADDLIIDGHHRYLASLLANFDLERVQSNKTLATAVNNWNSIDFVDEDWDSDKDVEIFNKMDALRNDLSVEEIVELLK